MVCWCLYSGKMNRPWHFLTPCNRFRTDAQMRILQTPFFFSLKFWLINAGINNSKCWKSGSYFSDEDICLEVMNFLILFKLSYLWGSHLLSIFSILKATDTRFLLNLTSPVIMIVKYVISNTIPDTNAHWGEKHF